MIKKSAYLVNSKVNDEVKIYSHARIVDSLIKNACIVGDYSRVTSSTLNEFVRIDRNCLIYHTVIERYTYFGTNDVIMHSEIGQFCSVSWGTTIGAANHDYNKVTTHDFLYNDYYGIKPEAEAPSYNRFEKKTLIGNDVWIGTNATIGIGLTIGDGAVIGANAMVTKSVPPYAIVVGNPAKILKFRFDESIIKELLDLKWWDFPVEKIKTNYHLFQLSDITSFIREMGNL